MVARRSTNVETEAHVQMAKASMRRAIRRLNFETHPILGRPCCAIEHKGDVILFDEQEIEQVAELALTQVIAVEVPRFTYLPDVRLDFVCRQRLETTAAHHVPRNWII